MTGKTAQPKREDIGKKLAKLAHHLADRVLGESPDGALTVGEEASIFNALRAYYAMVNRLNKEPGDGKDLYDGWADSLEHSRPRGRNAAGLDPGTDNGLDF